jgi:hypothetical protein
VSCPTVQPPDSGAAGFQFAITAMTAPASSNAGTTVYSIQCPVVRASAASAQSQRNRLDMRPRSEKAT